MCYVISFISSLLYIIIGSTNCFYHVTNNLLMVNVSCCMYVNDLALCRYDRDSIVGKDLHICSVIHGGDSGKIPRWRGFTIPARPHALNVKCRQLAMYSGNIQTYFTQLVVQCSLLSIHKLSLGHLT